MDLSSPAALRNCGGDDDDGSFSESCIYGPDVSLKKELRAAFPSTLIMSL